MKFVLLSGLCKLICFYLFIFQIDCNSTINALNKKDRSATSKVSTQKIETVILEVKGKDVFMSYTRDGLIVKITQKPS